MSLCRSLMVKEKLWPSVAPLLRYEVFAGSSKRTKRREGRLSRQTPRSMLGPRGRFFEVDRPAVS